MLFLTKKKEREREGKKERRKQQRQILSRLRDPTNRRVEHGRSLSFFLNFAKIEGGGGEEARLSTGVSGYSGNSAGKRDKKNSVN